MEQPVQPAQPAWLAGVQQPVAQPVYQQPVAEAPPDVKAHAYWFAWARQHEADISRCHLAAQAAAAALARGGDSAAAAQAAQQAAQTAAPGASAGVTAYTQSYSAFYAWAANELHLDPDRSHRLAHAATHATQSGVPAGQAADIGLQSIGLRREKKQQQPSWSSDPGVRSTVIGVVCLFALFFLPFYFVVLPVLGLLYAIRSFGSGRFYFAAAGLVLNAIATLLAALSFFNLV
jgi:hypothetical protein